MDKGHKFTDKEIERLENILKRHYGKTNKTVTEMLSKHLKRYEDRINEYQERLDSGAMTEQQYEDAVFLLITTGNDWMQTEDAILTEYVEADASAMEVVGASMITIYLYNALYKSQRMNSRASAKFSLDFELPRIFKDKDSPFAIITDLLNGRWNRAMFRFRITHLLSAKRMFQLLRCFLQSTHKKGSGGTAAAFYCRYSGGERPSMASGEAEFCHQARHSQGQVGDRHSR